MSKIVADISANHTSTIYEIDKKHHGKMVEVKFAEDKSSQEIRNKIFPAINLPFRFTNVSIFSVTPVDQSEFTANLLDFFYSEKELKKKILTDVGAGVGGNVWSLAQKVRHVNAVEMDSLQAKILEHNMNLLQIKNLTIHNANYIDVRYELSQDILFADPPWGGLDYKNQTELMTEYKSEGKSFPIDEVIKTTKAELIILKLPANHNMKCFVGIKKYFTHFLIYSEKTKLGRKFKSPLYRLAILADFPPVRDIPYGDIETRAKGQKSRLPAQKTTLPKNKNQVFPYFGFRNANFLV